MEGRQDPTISVILPYTKTKGNLAIKLYNASGGTAMPWQEALMYDILATGDDGLYIHHRFGYSIPRRNGKGEIIIMRELYALAIGEKVLHTAHRTSTSHSAWERICRILDKLGIEYKSIRAKGQEYIEMPDGGKVEFRTRTAKGGLGEGFDVLIIDEAQEYQTDQESTLKYVVTDSKNPQTIMCGTPPTAVSSGTVFLNMRKEILSGNSDSSGWAEWSVENITDIQNKDKWYECNPSLGLTLTERNVKDELDSSEAGVIDFNIQRLGLWLKYNQKSAISKSAWLQNAVKVLPKIKGKMCVGVKFGKDGDTCSMAIAVRTLDGRIFTEVIGRGSLSNLDFIFRFIKKAKPSIHKVIVDGDAGKDIVLQKMKEEHLGVPVFPKVNDVISASASFEKAIYKNTICHMDQKSLTDVVSNCEHRAIRTGGGFGYKALREGYDITLLESVMLAHFGCQNMKDAKQVIGY